MSEKFSQFIEFIPENNEDKKAALTIAELYPQFPDIQNAAKVLQEILDEGGQSSEFKKEMQIALENLYRATDILKLSLKNQQDYNLVDKRWMREPTFMKNALESGRLAMELDVRIDKDGEFWISHAVGARASLLPPFIHAMSTDEMEKSGRRFTLKEAFKIFSAYKKMGHRLILELKTIGSDESTYAKTVTSLKELIVQAGVDEAIAISSLSPGILMAVHDIMPETPLILNGGIVPIISYERPADKQDFLERSVGNLAKKIIPSDKKWRAFGVDVPWLGKLFEVVISASEKTISRPDGHGTQTGYALVRLPDDLVNVLQQQQIAGKEFGGLVSLSAVTIFANVLEMLGAYDKAREMREYYTKVVDKLQLGKMAATWGQNLHKIPVLGKFLFKRLDPKEQIRVFREQLGDDTLIYTKSPEEFAHQLQPLFASIYTEST